MSVDPLQTSPAQPNPGLPFNWPAELANLPAQPGVYRMLNAEGQIIYIGKAKVLKNRVRSYFQASAKHPPKVAAMVAQVARFSVIVTTTEAEALILEDTLIKAHQPRYNILLKDDKRYPWLMLTAEPFPRLVVTRNPLRFQQGKPAKHGLKPQFFGPYTQSVDLYNVLRLLRRHFPLRQRRLPLFKDRPCMNYSLGLCLGPCQNLVTEATYQQLVDDITQVLRGKTTAIKARLQNSMQQASEALDFEEAARLRDRLNAIEQLETKQHVVGSDGRLSQDVIALAGDEKALAAAVLTIREGRLVGSYSFDLPEAAGRSIHETLESFALAYYSQKPAEDLPLEILLDTPKSGEAEEESLSPEDLTAWLKHLHAGLIKPLKTTFKLARPKDKPLVELARQNAAHGLQNARLYQAQKAQNDPASALGLLQRLLGLPVFPQRMECYDISHFQGQHTVASMVVFEGGEPAKAQYRRFKIKCAEGKPDDFASMNEVLARRLEHLEDWGEPDLLIIDGGKGQLSSACEALEAAGLGEIPIISLAKRYEEVFLPGQSRPVLIPKDSPALFLLQQIRDEAHRFAITFHRERRAKATLPKA